MTGIIEGGVVVGATWGLYKLKSYWGRQEKERLAVVASLYSRVLGRGLDIERPRRRAGQPPLGADSNAAAALSAVQRWQDARDARRAASPAAMLTMPTCTVGLMKVNVCGGNGQPVLDAATAVCEDLKPRLLAAASGAVAPDELAEELALCHQLLMRPELFADASFYQVIAEVCGHLDRLLERIAGSLRTCAFELGKVLNLGRQLVDLTMPALLLAVTDAMGDALLPHLSAETLAKSAAKFILARDGGRSLERTDAFVPFWRTEAGELLREVLGTKHFRELWRTPATSKGEEGAVRNKVLVVKFGENSSGKLGWIDKLGGHGSLESSGLCMCFRSQDYSQLLDEHYLSLFEHLDDFIKFLSMLAVYRNLANIGGDAAMFRIREGFHHLLNELQSSALRLRQLSLRVTEAAKRAATEIMVENSRRARDSLQWLERLQHIDEMTFDESLRSFLDAVQQTHFLSSAARQPELQGICYDTIQQLSDVTASDEFRSRCHFDPPKAALLDVVADVGAAGRPLALSPPPPVANTIEDEDGGATWSVERAFPVDVAYASRRPDVRLEQGFPSLGVAVMQLNIQSINCEEDFCIVRIPCRGTIAEANTHGTSDSGEGESYAFFVLYRTGAQEKAARALELEAPPEPSPDDSPLIDHDEDFEEVATHDVPDDVPPDGHTAEQNSGKTAVSPALPPLRRAAAKEEDDYYLKLFIAALPVFGDDEAMRLERLTVEQVAKLLAQAELAEGVLERIRRTERCHGAVNVDDLSILVRLGRHVAEEQAKHRDVDASSTGSGRPLPALRGFTWDGRRLRMSGV